MELTYPVTVRLELIAGKVRLLAELLLSGTDLRHAGRDTFAWALRDVVEQLEQIIEELRRDDTPAPEARP